MTRVLVVGAGGRESSIVTRLAETADVCAFVSHRNSSIVSAAADLQVGDVCPHGGRRLRTARSPGPRDRERRQSARGRRCRRVAGPLECRPPGQAGKRLRIEWDKTTARELVADACPAANPRHEIVTDPRDLAAAIGALLDVPVAVKPAGLTGGKGVRIMGPHLADHNQAREYAAGLLETGPRPRAVIVEERIDAIEFTIQALTDGSHHVLPPATFDYPYRHDGDNGAGTGGMGCYTATPSAPGRCRSCARPTTTRPPRSSTPL